MSFLRPESREYLTESEKLILAANRQIITEFRKDREALLDTRDRVDILLKEYEELKRINRDLQIRLNQAERILGMLDIPADMIQRIDPDSVKTYSAETFDPNIFVRKRRFRIEFNVEEYD